jgi:hypothetical protein
MNISAFLRPRPLFLQCVLPFPAEGAAANLTLDIPVVSLNFGNQKLRGRLSPIIAGSTRRCAAICRATAYSDTATRLV